MLVFEPGQFIGKYCVVRLIGAGGMGAVYEVENPGIGQRAALKLLTVDMQAQPELFQRFINEARAANQIKHPGVVQVHDFGQLDDKTPWMVMEHLEGESLANRLGEALRLPGHCLGMDGLWVVSDLASVLTAAHARGIVHRDLKPANVMLVPDPATVTGERAKLLDFGIAKLHGDKITQSGAMLGTPIYMAPEQFRSAADVDGQADVYSLGVIAYQILCGRLPQYGDNPYALMAARMFESVPPLQQFAPSLPVEVVALVMRMLDREAERRPNISEVELEVRRILGLPAPRQSGFHDLVVVPGSARSSDRARATEDEDSLGSTTDMPVPDMGSMQALAVPTPSQAVGEISSRDVAAPLSLSSMPSVPVPITPPPRTMSAISAHPTLEGDIAAPDTIADPTVVKPEPAAPPVHARRRLPAYILGAALALGAGVFALWPFSAPPPATRPPVDLTPPQQAPQALKGAVTPKPSPPPPEPRNPDLAPPEPMPVSGTGSKTGAPSPAPSPISKTGEEKSGGKKPGKKPAGRGCRLQQLSSSCSFEPALTKRQRMLLIDAFHQTGARLCTGETFILSGFPKEPLIRGQGAASLPADTQSYLNLALGGLPPDGAFPREIEIRCSPR